LVLSNKLNHDIRLEIDDYFIIKNMVNQKSIWLGGEGRDGGMDEMEKELYGKG
jgi:hypothetical protein